MSAGAFSFGVLAADPGSRARTGLLKTAHGDVPTPAFMPVGTRGVVKALTPSELREAGTSMILGNTYHLLLRPGPDLVKRMGGLQRFTAWDGPVLTDSGGFQVFSLAALRRIDEEGVEFRSHLDGSAQRLTPESSVAIQEALGADILMAFDECPPQPSAREANVAALERTTRWAERCLAAHHPGAGALFGIVQGGPFEDLRARHAAELTALPFDGFAIGGVSVGETRDEVRRTVQVTAPLLPGEKPRYLMGVGRPEELVEFAGEGVDLFDCVLPTRNARNGQLFTSQGPLNIKRGEYESDPRPADPDCGCSTCRTFTRAYLRHLFRTGDRLSARLNSIHNIHFYQALLARTRAAIDGGTYPAFREATLKALAPRDALAPREAAEPGSAEESVVR